MKRYRSIAGFYPGTQEIFHAGEVRRYLRFARLESNNSKRAACIRQAKLHGRAAWHMAEVMERQGK